MPAASQKRHRGYASPSHLATRLQQLGIQPANAAANGSSNDVLLQPGTLQDGSKAELYQVPAPKLQLLGPGPNKPSALIQSSSLTLEEYLSPRMPLSPSHGRTQALQMNHWPIKVDLQGVQSTAARYSPTRLGRRRPTRNSSFGAPQIQASHLPVALPVQTHDGGAVRRYSNTWSNPFAVEAIANSMNSDDFTPQHAISDCLALLRHTQNHLQGTLAELAATRAELAAREAGEQQPGPPTSPLHTSAASRSRTSGGALGQLWTELQQARTREDSLKNKVLHLISDNLTLIDALEVAQGKAGQSSMDAVALQARVKQHLQGDGQRAHIITSAPEEVGLVPDTQGSADSSEVSLPAPPRHWLLVADDNNAADASDVDRQRGDQSDARAQLSQSETTQGMGPSQGLDAELSALLRDMIAVGNSLLDAGVTGQGSSGQVPVLTATASPPSTVPVVQHAGGVGDTEAQPMPSFSGTNLLPAHTLGTLFNRHNSGAAFYLNGSVGTLLPEDEIKMLSLEPQEAAMVTARYGSCQSDDESESAGARAGEDDTLDDPLDSHMPTSQLAVAAAGMCTTLQPPQSELRQAETAIINDTGTLDALKVAGFGTVSVGPAGADAQPGTPDAHHPPHASNLSPGMGDDTTVSFYKWHAEPAQHDATGHVSTSYVPTDPHELSAHQLSVQQAATAADSAEATTPADTSRPRLQVAGLSLVRSRALGQAPGRAASGTSASTTAATHRPLMDDVMVAAFCTSLVLSGAWASHLISPNMAAQMQSEAHCALAEVCQQEASSVASHHSASVVSSAPISVQHQAGMSLTGIEGQSQANQSVYRPAVQLPSAYQPAEAPPSYISRQGPVWLNPIQLHTTSGPVASAWVANVPGVAEAPSDYQVYTWQPSCGPTASVHEAVEPSAELDESAGGGWVQLGIGAGTAVLVYGICSLLGRQGKPRQRNRM